MTGHEALKWG